jgi:transposase
MSQKRTYYGFTTPQQRKLLFETWEATGSIAEACQKARVSLRLFYYWKERFDQQGYAGLEKFGSRVAHKLNYKDKAIEKQVIEMRRANPDWGKLRISQEMAKGNNWVAVVSPNTVRRMLRTAGTWPESSAEGEKKSTKT